jgi:hypothetical protein
MKAIENAEMKAIVNNTQSTFAPLTLPSPPRGEGNDIEIEEEIPSPSMGEGEGGGERGWEDLEESEHVMSAFVCQRLSQ